VNGTELRPVLDKKVHEKPGIMGLAGYEKTSPIPAGFLVKTSRQPASPSTRDSPREARRGHRFVHGQWLASITSDLRECIFTQTVVFWAWLSQFLEPNESCAKALALVEGWCETNGESRPTFDTSAYCKARLRLPDEVLDEVHKKVESFAEARVEGHHLWHGLRLKAIDGTSVKLMDTPENQAAYPQPSGQSAGCGFPVMGVVGVLDLARGNL